MNSSDHEGGRLGANRTNRSAAGSHRGDLAARRSVRCVQRGLFDDTHEQFRSAFATFLAREMVPHRERWESSGIVDRSLFTAAGANGFLGIDVPEEYGGGGVADFRFNVGDRRGDPARRRQRRRPRHHAAQRHLPAVLPPRHERGAEAALAARHLRRRADHGRGDDRTGHRLRSRVDDDDRRPRRRRLRRQRLEDVHHQRHQRRPRDHRRQDRPGATPPGDVVARRRA